MRIRSDAVIPAGLALSLIAGPALAHTGHTAGTMMDGLAHPITGLDHLLAMVAVGLWAALRAERALWAWPAAFLASMAVGAALGGAYPGAPLAEPAIAASVIILGVATAAALRAPVLFGAALIAAFGLAHGYAHGAEAPGGLNLAFGAGFLVSTAALHAAGLAAGLALGRFKAQTLARGLGALAAIGGAWLALS